MIQSIHFEVKKWDYNEKAAKTNIRTDSNFTMHPLRREGEIKAEGICFIWHLILTCEELQMLYYKSEEYIIVPENSRSDLGLLKALELSYDRTSQELAFRNRSVGLDAGFPLFENHHRDPGMIRKVLDM